ncbi:MAG: hypothetical protein AAFO69_01270, partial [Bacteroidota bacterium]
MWYKYTIWIEGTKVPSFIVAVFVEKAREKIKGQVVQLLEEHSDLFLIDVIVKGNIGTVKVVVILDGDNGVGIDNCVSISRQLSGFLEEEDLIEGKYTLEVTSSGLEHPLQLPRQYTKNVGRNVRVVCSDQSTHEGKLASVDEEKVTL